MPFDTFVSIIIYSVYDYGRMIFYSKDDMFRLSVSHVHASSHSRMLWLMRMAQKLGPHIVQ